MSQGPVAGSRELGTSYPAKLLWTGTLHTVFKIKRDELIPCLQLPVIDKS